MIRMIGLDLDGTLLNQQKEITKYTLQVLAKAFRKGVEIVPVTGRPYHGIPARVFEVPGIRYIITTNGASTYDRVAQRLLRKKQIAIEQCIQVLRLTDGRDVIKEVFVNGYGYETEKTLQKLLANVQGTPIESYIRQSRKPVTDLYSFLHKQQMVGQPETGVEGISLMCGSREEKEEIWQQINQIEGIRMVSPAPGDIEINHLHADKGEALLALGRRLGITDKEIMGIGDSDNDVGMLRGVGLSVAMGNAGMEIKRIAHVVTDDHNHEGVARIVEKIL